MSDPRIEAAVAHWGPRFVEHGVPIGDFLELTSTIERWEDWCGAWSARAAIHETEGDTAAAAGHHASAGLHFLTAAMEYHFAKFLNVHDIPEMRATHEQAVAAHRKAHPYMRPPAERIEFPYGNHTLSGNLRIPASRQPPPVVVLIPGLDSAKEELSGMEPWFLDRGLATFSIDGPGQGEAEYELPIEIAYEKPVAAAIDALQERGEVDATRIGAMGVSLGGFYVVRAAAFEPRLRAIVSLSGPYDVYPYLDDLPPMTRLAFQVRSHSATWEETKEKMRAMNLRGVAERVTVPSYIITGRNDRLIPATDNERMGAEISGPVRLQIVEDGNHVATNKAYLYRPHMGDWMVEQLAGAP